MVSAREGVGMVIGLFIAALLGAELLPVAFDAWFNASTGSWGGITATLWPLIPVFILLAVVFYFLFSSDYI